MLFSIGGALLISIPLAILLLCRTVCLSDGSTEAGRQLLSCACWGLVLVGITGTTLASRGIRWGWLLLFGLQPVWIAYALATAQYGLMLASLAYGAAQLSGFCRTSSR
jgi:hypothetical protein